MSQKNCVLYDRECIDCGECMFCDLDPLKICDNCGKCLNFSEFATLKIDSLGGVDLTKNKPNSQNSQSTFNGKTFKINKKLK